jgi:hypothetical protein
MNCQYLALLDLSWARTLQGNLMCVSICDGIYQYCFRAGILGRARVLGYIEVVASHGWKEKLLPSQFDCKVSALLPLDDQMDLEALTDAESQVCFLAIRWEWLCWCSSWTC